MIVLHTKLLRTAGAVFLLSACRDAGLAIGPAEVAGSYELRSVQGTIGMLETPVSGQIALTITGLAERRVSYQIDSQGTLREFVAQGTYRLTDSLVELSLRENGGTGDFLWRVQARLLPDGALRLSYPRAADGTIVEIYERR